MDPSSCSNGIFRERTCLLCLWLRVDVQSLDQSQASGVDRKFALASGSPCPFPGGVCHLGRGVRGKRSPDLGSRRGCSRSAAMLPGLHGVYTSPGVIPSLPSSAEHLDISALLPQ